MKIDFFKVVAALPETLTANALYLVRAGKGFQLYASDATGKTAHPLIAETAPVYLHAYLQKNENIPTTSGGGDGFKFDTLSWAADADSAGAWVGNAAEKHYLVPRDGFYAVSVQNVYKSADKKDFLTRIRVAPNDAGTRATNFYFYNANRADGLQFVAFTRIVLLKKGDKLQWPSRADGFTAYELRANEFGIKTEATVALVAPM